MEFVVIGTGNAGKRHLQNLIAMKQKIVAIADPKFEPEERDGIKAYGDPELCLWEQANSRAVIIASPHQFHKPQFNMAVDSGAFSILVEKPIAVTKEEASSMVYASENLGVRAAVAHNWRYHEAYQDLLRIHRRQPLNMYSLLSSDDITEWPNWGEGCYMLDKKYGGVGLTTSVHSIDMAVKLNGPALGVLGRIEGERHTLPQAIWIRIYHENGSQTMIMTLWGENTFFAQSLLNPSGGSASDLRAGKYQETTGLMHHNMLADFLKFSETGERPDLLCDPREAYEGLVILYATIQSVETESLVEILREEEE